ncbi:hypothetical protein GCM10009815_17820 [Nocardioides marmoribigeumensis]
MLSIASDASGPATPAVRLDGGPVAEELGALLVARNGFYAFESALHVFGSGPSVTGGSLEEWNAEHGWRVAYGELAEGLLFFAEDVFGVQFALRGDRVVTFDPETGDVGAMGTSIEDWADQLLSDYRELTGYPVAHDWQSRHGTLVPGTRLVPKRPFVLGGAFDVANLYALDATEGMRVRGDLAAQLRDLPDGAQVRYEVRG